MRRLEGAGAGEIKTGHSRWIITRWNLKKDFWDFLLFLVLGKELQISPCWWLPRCATLRCIIWKICYFVESFKDIFFLYYFINWIHGFGGVYVGHLHPSAFLIILFYSHGILWPLWDWREPCRPSFQCPCCVENKKRSENFSQMHRF